MPIGENFATVLEAARTGADWAWGVLYRDLAPSVLGYLRGRGAHDPDDRCGEVFLQVVRDLGSFEGDEAAFRAWVFTIARNRLLDDRRRRDRRPETLVPTGSLTAEQASEGTAEEAERAVTTEEIRRLIATLSPDQADVLLLRIVGGLTIEEVARAVGKRTGAVKALQRRGLRALERQLDDPPYPSGRPRRFPG